MKRQRWFSIGTVCLVLAAGSVIAAVSAADDAPLDQTSRQPARSVAASSSDARALALQIDRLLAAKWAEARVVPARAADDAEYMHESASTWSA